LNLYPYANPNFNWTMSIEADTCSDCSETPLNGGNFSTCYTYNVTSSLTVSFMVVDIYGGNFNVTAYPGSTYCIGASPVLGPVWATCNTCNVISNTGSPYTCFVISPGAKGCTGLQEQKWEKWVNETAVKEEDMKKWKDFPTEKTP